MFGLWSFDEHRATLLLYVDKSELVPPLAVSSRPACHIVRYQASLSHGDEKWLWLRFGGKACPRPRENWFSVLPKQEVTENRNPGWWLFDLNASYLNNWLLLPTSVVPPAIQVLLVSHVKHQLATGLPCCRSSLFSILHWLEQGLGEGNV